VPTTEGCESRFLKIYQPVSHAFQVAHTAEAIREALPKLDLGAVLAALPPSFAKYNYRQCQRHLTRCLPSKTGTATTAASNRPTRTRGQSPPPDFDRQLEEANALAEQLERRERLREQVASASRQASATSKGAAATEWKIQTKKKKKR
jgi:hypothetical protein